MEGEVGERVALIAETMQNSELLARQSAVATIPTSLAPRVLLLYSVLWIIPALFLPGCLSFHVLLIAIVSWTM